MKKYLAILLIPALALKMASGQTDPDSTIHTIYAWKLTDNFSEKQEYSVDTIFFQYQIFNPNFKTFPYNAYLGNLGSPALENDYLKQIQETNLPFLKPYKYYVHLPEKQIYFNTRKPFSDLNYTTGTGKQKNEQTLRILHTQNVNENFNLGIDFDLISSDGRYSNQKTSLKSLSLFSSYILEKYKIHAAFSRNVITVNENGGIIDEQDLKDNKSEDVPVNLGNLNNAESNLRNLNFLLVQNYTVGKISKKDSLQNHTAENKKLKLLGTFSHILLYQKNHRTYEDQDPRTGFYENAYLDTLMTTDTVYYQLLSNTLQFDFQSNPERKFRFGGRVGAISEIEKFSTIIPVDTLVKHNPPDNYSSPGIEVWINNNDTTFKNLKNRSNANLAIAFQLFNDLGGKFNWKAWGKYYLSGYKMGDLSLEGTLQTSFSGEKGRSDLIIHGKLKNYRPNYWFNHFASNNFIWNNNFQNITETTVIGKYENPGRKLLAKASYTLLDKYVYFDTLAIPAQDPGIVSILGLTLEKDFILGRWHFINQLAVQTSDKESILPLPLFMLHQTTYFQHNFHFKKTNGNLLTQWGFDLFYHTPYKGYAYMPATGQFHLQKEEAIGNYPFLDLFINIKLKRTRFFLKYEHVASGLLGEKYFTVQHYPMNQRVFKFGLSWTFYD